MQGRQPNGPSLYPAGLAAVEQIMHHLVATGESPQSRGHWLVLIIAMWAAVLLKLSWQHPALLP